MKRNRKGWPEIREQLARRGSAVPVESVFCARLYEPQVFPRYVQGV